MERFSVFDSGGRLTRPALTANRALLQQEHKDPTGPIRRGVCVEFTANRGIVGQTTRAQPPSPPYVPGKGE
jgi:hypothetical protein